MKKAYVKPVFLAEEFVAASSYVASTCGVSKHSPFDLYVGMDLCGNNTNGDGHFWAERVIQQR